MEERNFFNNYEDYLNDLQDKLFRIQIRYNECQSWAFMDYEKGLLSADDYKKINNCRMDTFIEGVNSKYVLSREEVDFVVKYGEVDTNGILLKTILKSELLDRLALLKEIFRSVVIFSYFESFDGITKRMKFKEDVVSTFGKQREDSLTFIERMKKVRGANYQNSPHYKREAEKLENANKALKFAEQIITFDDEYLTRLLSSYYGIKYRYYDWYRKMSLKEENDNGFVYQEHLGLMQGINGNISCLAQKRNLLEEEQNGIKKYSSDLINFLERIAELDLTKYEIPKEKKSFFKRSVEVDTREILFEVFKDLILFPETFNYIVNCLSVEDKPEDNAYDAKVVFDKFCTETYGEDSEAISIVSFVNDFRRAVTAYYKKVIVQYEKAIENSKKGVIDYSKTLDISFGKALAQSQVISDIHLGYTGKESVLLSGFTFEELESMYFSLKRYIIDNVTNEMELNTIIKKV